MKIITDFEPDASLPKSIREIVEQEISYTTHNGNTNNPLECDSMEELLKRVYAHIEQQALEVYRSNEPWALKAWAYSNILQGVIASEATEPMADALINPIVEFQNQSFNPLTHFRKRLERKSPRTKEAYMQCAARFVLKEGIKENYTDEDIEEL